MEIIFKGSPNKQPRIKPVKKIVIHWFGTGTIESANARFQNPASQVSAHYGISKGRIWEWVKEIDVAYHAGNLSVNQESIGIEHDATLDHPLAEEDYELSAQLIREIAKRHNIKISKDTVIGHRSIISTQCPGTIDINKIINLANNMAQIKTQAKGASRRIVIEAADENEWNVLTKVYGKDASNPEENVKDN